jgi:Homeodomain-like domain
VKIRADIAELLQQGMSDLAISQRLGCDRRTAAKARKALGLPKTPGGSKPQPLADLVDARTEPVPGGHRRWTGHLNSTGTPVVHYQGRPQTAARLVFRLHHGRNPVGNVRAGCDYEGCIEGAHLDDRSMRERTRKAYAAIFGEAA